MRRAYCHGFWLILLAWAPLGAQRPPIELFGVESRLYPDLKQEDPVPNTYEENVKIQPQPVRLKVALPIRWKSDRSVLAVSLSYARLGLSVHGWPENEPFPEGPFHQLQIPVMYHRSLRNEAWGLRMFFTPGYSSDFHDTGSRGFRFQGGGFFEKKSPKGILSFGLMLLNNYGEPRVFPAVAWAGTLAAKHSFVVRLPVLLSWMYQYDPSWSWGAAARVSGGHYEIGRPDVFRRHQLKYATGTIGPFVTRQFGSWGATLETGYVFLHDLEVRYRRHQIRDYDLERSMFMSAQIQKKI